MNRILLNGPSWLEPPLAAQEPEAVSEDQRNLSDK